MNLTNWIQLRIRSNFEIAGFIANELIEPGLNLDAAIHLESLLNSFNNLQVLIGLELWTPTMLEQLHNYLAHKTCNITNFRLVVIGHPEIANWWEQYKRLYQLASFEIIEVRDLPLLAEHLQPYAKQVIDNVVWGRHIWYRNKVPDFCPIEYPALYMAGTMPGTFDSGYAKTYLLLLMAQCRPYILIDRCWPLPDKQQFISWLDYATYWQNQDHLEIISEVYDQELQISYTSNPKSISMEQSFDLYQKSFASIVRETVMTLPYGCVSEKTLRAFMYKQFVIPTTFCGVKHLEDAGFIFDHKFFSYEYQYISDFVKRTQQLRKQLMYLVKLPINELGEHRIAHRDMYEHNQRRAFQLTQLV